MMGWIGWSYLLVGPQKTHPFSEPTIIHTTAVHDTLLLIIKLECTCGCSQIEQQCPLQKVVKRHIIEHHVKELLVCDVPLSIYQ